MSETLPFMNSTGLVGKILNKIIEAQTPLKYTQDFQANKLGYGSGSAKPFIPLLKRIGLIGPDGTPTDLYKRFRNSTTRGSAMASAIRNGYAQLYSVSEYAHDLDSKKLRDAVIQVTGHPSDSSTVSAIVGTFNALKAFANFNQESEPLSLDQESSNGKPITVSSVSPTNDLGSSIPAASRGMNLSYTINLNLPETKDPEVFDAIFTSLKTKLLS
jgi:hypothetical protein